MYRPMRWLLVGVLVFGGACGSNNTAQPPALPDAKPPQPPKTAPQKAPQGTPRYQSSADPASSKDTPAPPKGAQYTIFCARIEGDMHVQRAMRMKNELIANTGMKDWYTLSEEGQTLLYYGYYRTINEQQDAKEAARARADRQKIDLMADSMGNRPFRQAMIVELSAPDPVAPPEWNLLNAKGAYTLQIAAYKDNPARKEAAVEAVREARAMGIDAYYYHGDSSSLVCIGAWPENAIRVSDQTISTQRGNNDPNQAIFVVPGSQSEELNQHFRRAGERAKAKVVQPTVEIIDPTLRQAMAQYPHNVVNGALIKRTANGKEQFEPSLLQPIPRHQAVSTLTQHPQQPIDPLGVGVPDASGDRPANPAGAAPTSATPPQQQQRQTTRQPSQPPAQPGAGRLKSIGG